MRTLLISMILIAMMSCLKAPILQEDLIPTAEIDDKIVTISRQLARQEEPELSIIKDIVVGKLPGWEKPIEYIAGNHISNSMTLLQIMAYYPYPYQEIKPLIEAWIKHGGDTQAKDAMGRVALHLAATGVNTPIVQLLLDLKVKDTMADSAGKLAIHHACQRCEKQRDGGNNMYASIKLLLESMGSISVGSLISTDPSGAGSRVSTEQALDGPDPLRRHRERAKQDFLAYVNKLDNRGNSPLYYTSQAMHRSLKKLEKASTDAQQEGLQRGYKQAEDCYLYLKNFRADANLEKIRDNKLKILMLGKKLVSSQVTEPKNYIKYFIEKVEKGESEKIASLTAIIQADAPINEGGPTILYWLINNGHQEVARMLVEESEEEALVKSLSGNTSSTCPVYAAVSQGDFALAKQLIYGKAIQKYEGRYAAQESADKVESEVAKARGGVITRSYADNGKTLLAAACESGEVSVVQLILESMAICAEKYEHEQNSPLLANQIMGEFKYLPSDTSGYEKSIGEFIEKVRIIIKDSHKKLDKKASRTTGRSWGGSLSLFVFGGSAQGGKTSTAKPWDTSRGHTVSAARQAWRDKRNRIWERSCGYSQAYAQ